MQITTLPNICVHFFIQLYPSLREFIAGGVSRPHSRALVCTYRYLTLWYLVPIRILLIAVPDGRSTAGSKYNSSRSRWSRVPVICPRPAHPSNYFMENEKHTGTTIAVHTRTRPRTYSACAMKYNSKTTIYGTYTSKKLRST